MARTKRIWREWQHPRASNGRFARKGSPEWVKSAAEKFRNADEALKRGTSAPGMPGGQRRGISRGAKAERVFAAHDASRVTGLGRQPVQGPQRPPRVDTPRDSGKTGGMSTTTPTKADAQATLASIEHLKRPNAKKGDLVAVETTESSYSVTEGRKETTSVRIGVVTSTDKNGKVTSWSTDPDGSTPRPVTHRDKTYKLEKERVDVGAAMAAAADNPWPHDPSKKGKPYDSLAEAQAAMRPFLGDQTEKLKAAAAVAPKGRDPMRLKAGDRVQIPGFRQGDPVTHAEVTGDPYAYNNGRYDNGVRVPMRLLDGPNAGKEGLHSYKKSDKAQVIPEGVVAREKAQGALARIAEQMSAGLDRIKKEIDDTHAVSGRKTDRGDSAGDLEIGKQLSALQVGKPDFNQVNAVRDAAKAKASAEVDRELGHSSMNGYEVRAKLTSAEGNKAAMQLQLDERKADLAKAKQLHSQIQGADYAELQQRETIKRIQSDVEMLQGRVTQYGHEADRAREQLREAVRRGGPDLQRRLDQAAQDRIGGVVRSGGYGSHEGVTLMQKIDAAPDRKAAIRALTSSEQSQLHSETDRISAHGENNAKIWRAALKGVDMTNVTPEQRDKWTAATEGSFRDVNRTLAARERRDLALSRLAALKAHDAGDNERERAHLDAAVKREQAGLDAAQAELADLEPKYTAALDRIRGAINDVRASQGLKPAKIDEKKIDAGYAKRLESQKITRPETPPPPPAAPKSAMRQVSDTIAAQRGLDTMRAQRAASETPTMEAIKSVPTQRTAYHDMSRSNLVALSQAAGLPVRGRTNDRLAEALHRRDQENKAAKNPSGIGTPSTQHEELPQHDGGMARQAKLNEGVQKLRDKMAEQRAAKEAEQTIQDARDAATLRNLARQREKSMAELYAQHAGLTREQFDALPADQREAVLADLRKVRDAGEQRPYTIGSNRSGFYGATIRGMQDMEHTAGAKKKLRDLLETKPNPDDYTVAGRARRAAAGDPYAIDGTMEDLQAIASANKWGYVGSWKKDKARDYLRNHAIAHDVLPEKWDTASVAEAMRGADSRKALALLDIQDADGRLTLADLNAIATQLGLPKPKGKDKRARMHDLAGQAKGAAPKAEAAQEAAPETPKAPLIWIDKATGREVTNPGQVGIVRGDIVKADSDAGKAAIAAREARRSANLDKARAAATEKRVSELEVSKDPRDNAAKIKAITDGRMTHADLYRTAMAGPSGQRAPVLAGRVRHTPDNPSGEFRVVDRDGQLAGWVTPVLRNGEQKYAVHSENYDGEVKLEGWADSLAHAADVLTHGEAAASTGGTLDARRISGRLFEPNPARSKTVDQLDREALDREIRQHREALNNPNLGPNMRASHERALARLEAERRGEAPPEAPKGPATTRGRFARTLKVGQLDTRRDSSQNGGGSNTPTTTGANMDQQGDKFAAQEAAHAKALRADDLTGLSDAELHDALVETSRARRATKVHSAADLLSSRIVREQIRRRDKERLPAKVYAEKYPAGVADLKPQSWGDVQKGDTITIHPKNGKGVRSATPRQFRVLDTEEMGTRGEYRRVSGYFVNANGTPNRAMNKYDTPDAPDGKGDRFELHLRDVNNVEKNTRGGNVTASDVSAPTARPGEPTLGVEETSKGRTTTITLPDGTKATRTSQTKAYTHAVVGTVDLHAQARSTREHADRLEEYANALEAWIADGSDLSKLKRFYSGGGSAAESQAGIKRYRYFLPGFEPQRREIRHTRYGGGGHYYEATSEGPAVDSVRVDREGRAMPLEAEWEKEYHGPQYHQKVLSDARENVAKSRKRAAELAAGPRYEYHVARWSQSADNAFKAIGSPELSGRHTSYQVVGVGGIAKKDKRPAKVVPTAAEKLAAKEAKAAAEKADRTKREQDFYDRTRKEIEQAITDGRDPEGELKFTSEAGLRALAKAYGVKLPRLPRDSYGRSQPLDRENARKLIVAKLREEMQGKA